MKESSYAKLNWKIFKWLLFAGIIPPFYFQLRFLFDYQIDKLHSPMNFLFWMGVSISMTVGLSVVVFQEIRWLETVLPWKKRAKTRIAVEFLLTNATVLVAMAILGIFTYQAHCDFHEGVSFRSHMLQELTTGVILLTIVLSMIEGSYFFKEWKNSLVMTEQLKKESLQAQLESLKNQVNPHFLFNSLNVLSNLVHKDANRAEEFIDQFASVYRYVLNIQDKMAVTLGEELEFLKSYIFLQKIRFQDGFEVAIEIDEHCYGHYVVPMSLQMMVENAIKHNVVSSEEPLRVQIYLDHSRIHVVNKINLRTDENKSVGMGLNNLRQRYFLMAGILPDFENTEGEFVATLPLIKPEKTNEDAGESDCCNHRGRKIRL